MSEMTAKEYAKQFTRMCGTCRKIDTEEPCDECPFASEFLVCETALTNHTDKAIEFVSKWAEEHPERTYMSNLLEKFPKTQMSENECPIICRNRIYDSDYKKGDCCNKDKTCFECWNEIMPEVAE